MRDMVAKNRHAKRPQAGSQNGFAKLDEEKVSYILRSDKSQAALARELGVSASAISLIKSGKNWAHISGPSINTVPESI